MIPFMNLKHQHDSFLREYFQDLQKLFKTCEFIGTGSKTVAAFEKDFADYIGTKHAIGVASGTDALLLPLHALGIGPGDEVIMGAFGFIATADVVVRLGGKPVFVDVDPTSYNIDPTKIEAAITEKTKAIVPVHLCGLTCDMDPILDIAKRHKLAVLEDVAQACGTAYNGRKCGSIGTAGGFSFYPTKNLGAAGDAGIITTNDDALAETIYRFRDHGRTPQATFESIGYNSRLDTIQALYLHHKLPELEDSLLDRIENAKLYKKLLEDTEVKLPPVSEDMTHTFNLFTIQVRDRDRLRAFLNEKGIQSAVYYPLPMHLTPVFQFLGYEKGSFPVAEEICRNCLSLPVWPGLKKKEIEQVVEVVKQFLENNVALQLR